MMLNTATYYKNNTTKTNPFIVLFFMKSSENNNDMINIHRIYQKTGFLPYSQHDGKSCKKKL